MTAMEVNEEMDLEAKRVLEFLSEKTGFSQRAILSCLKTPVYEKKFKQEKDKVRVLWVPKGNLMELQRLVLQSILYLIPVSAAAHGAVPQRSVWSNTEEHINTNPSALFKVDFKDAYPTVTQKMIVDRLTPLFAKRFDGVKPERLASSIAKLGTFRNMLPQGAPMSPCLMNLVCYELDLALLTIAYAFRLVYTRYIDDCCFSTVEKRVPQEAIDLIVKTIKAYGFNLNKKKTGHRKIRHGMEPKIVGIVLKKGDDPFRRGATGLRRTYVNELRSELHRATRSTELSKEQTGAIQGKIGWVLIAYGGKIPTRLKKPLGNFLRAQCSEKLQTKYAHLTQN